MINPNPTQPSGSEPSDAGRSERPEPMSTPGKSSAKASTGPEGAAGAGGSDGFGTGT